MTISKVKIRTFLRRINISMKFAVIIKERDN